MISGFYFFGVLTCFVAFCSSKCTFSKDGYSLSWSFDGDTVIFNLAVPVSPQRKDEGFWTGVGFGKNMDKGDFLLIQSAGKDGDIALYDRTHGMIGHTRPVLDEQQDGKLESTSFENGIFHAEFSRAVDTGDWQDQPISDPKLDNCQFFMFPREAESMIHQHLQGATEDPPYINIHGTTPVVQRYCQADCE